MTAPKKHKSPTRKIELLANRVAPLSFGFSNLSLPSKEDVEAANAQMGAVPSSSVIPPHASTPPQMMAGHQAPHWHLSGSTPGNSGPSIVTDPLGLGAAGLPSSEEVDAAASNLPSGAPSSSVVPPANSDSSSSSSSDDSWRRRLRAR